MNGFGASLIDEYSRSFLIQDCYPNASNSSTPGAARPATSSASRYPLPILAAVMSAPEETAEAYVKTAESLPLEQSQSSTETGETESTPSNQQLTAACIDMATNTEGRVYGLGLLQYVDSEPKESPAASLLRNVGVDG
ncbi:hypothetical protein Bca101_056914 [Brassica carinata]